MASSAQVARAPEFSREEGLANSKTLESESLTDPLGGRGFDPLERPLTASPDKPADDEGHKAKAMRVNAALKVAQSASEDSAQFEAKLPAIKKEYELQAIELVDLGTPEVGVKFRINPWFWYKVSGSGQLFWNMKGRAVPAKTDVHHESQNLTVNSVNHSVGKRMRAAPLAPDAEPGSPPDASQDVLMAALRNSGNSSLANDQKYIKGHLLNDNVGGQGQHFNLFPITADANAKHLAFVEKFVKADIQRGYVVNYAVDVAIGTQVAGTATAPGDTVDSTMSFSYQRLDATGSPVTNHSGVVQSVFNSSGAAPFDIATEYASEYAPLNKGKSTPSSIAVGGEQELSGWTPAPMTHVSMPPLSSVGSYAWPGAVKHFHQKVKHDASGSDYISVRNKDAAGVAVGDTIQTTSGAVVVNAVNPVSGGWTQFFF